MGLQSRARVWGLASRREAWEVEVASRLRIDFRQFVVGVDGLAGANHQAASGVSMARSVKSVCMSMRIRS